MLHLRNGRETGSSLILLNPEPHAQLCFFTEPMRTPKRLKIAETRSRLIAVDWESLGYNITRCHTFNVTICYHYMTANNSSKADCLDMDPKGKQIPLTLL